MNYYVMNHNSLMVHRDTLEGCRAWIAKVQAQWRSFGYPVPQFRIFYDSATEPCEIIG